MQQFSLSTAPNGKVVFALAKETFDLNMCSQWDRLVYIWLEVCKDQEILVPQEHASIPWHPHSVFNHLSSGFSDLKIFSFFLGLC